MLVDHSESPADGTDHRVPLLLDGQLHRGQPGATWPTENSASETFGDDLLRMFGWVAGPIYRHRILSKIRRGDRSPAQL